MSNTNPSFAARLNDSICSVKTPSYWQWLINLVITYNTQAASQICSDRFVSLGYPRKFQWVSRLGSWLRYCSDVAQRKTTKLCRMFGRLLDRYTIYTFLGLLPRNGILPGTKFILCPSLALSYIGSVTARHSSSGRQPNCGVEQRAPPVFGRAAITLGTDPHSSWRNILGNACPSSSWS